MAELSVAHRAALAQMIETAPDRVLDRLAQAVGAMPGERARQLQTMLTEAGRDRARRDRGLAALTPLFRPRPDQVKSLSFPPEVLHRLWKPLATGQADLLPHLDNSADFHVDSVRISSVTTRLCAAAAAIVRDQPEAIWPLSLGGAADGLSREEGIDLLAQVCDLGGLIHRAVPSLPKWTGRPDGDQIAELRLVLRDADAISPEGTRLLLEAFFAHIDTAPRILRLVVHVSPLGGRDSFLIGSELAPFVVRLIEAAETRLGRITAFQPGDPLDSLRADLDWIAGLLTEVEATVQIDSGSDWGQRLRQIRLGVSGALGRSLGGVVRRVEQALPMQLIKVPGQGRRERPDLGAAVDARAVAEAQVGLDLARTVRPLASTFGCDGQRQALVAEVIQHLTQYADHALEEINAGAVSDAARAGAWVVLTAGFLERIEAAPEGRSVRRRVAAAGVSAHPVSPRAA
jgi:hypothetical protein